MAGLILTSYGLTMPIGRHLIGEELKKDGSMEEKRIFLFHEPHYSVEGLVERACLDMGFQKENIVFSGRQKSNEDLLTMDYIYVTEGNTYEVLALMRERELEPVIKQAVQSGSTYIGASAGAMLAGVSIVPTRDRNFVRMEEKDFYALGLFDGVIIPHYTEEELECYIANSPGIEEKYKSILSVADDGILCIGR